MISFIKNLLRLGIVSSPGDDSDTIPSQQINYHGKLGNATAWYPYGLHAIASESSYVLVLSLNANSEERICIPTSMMQRPLGGSPGEVFLYHPDTGTKIHLTNAGDVIISTTNNVEMNSPTTVKITTPITEVVGDADVTGNVGIGGDVEITGSLTLTGTLNHDGASLGFRGATPTTVPTVTGGDGAVPALQSLLTILENMGLIIDGSS